MGDTVQFGVLGPVQVAAGNSGEPGVISAARLRALLAVLLWRANQAVPADELAELVWDGAPPRGAAEATRALVMRLRRRLDARAAARIVTRAVGYAVEVSDDELDAARLEALTQQAGAAVRVGQWEQAAETAAEALGLWRGTPLADVPSQLLRDQWVPRLDQLHVQALDWRIEADLHQDRHEQLIPELRELTGRYPLREGFHGQLMLALYRCDRQAEALDAYARARDVLVTELGVEPGPGLRELHQRILSADPALAVTRPAIPVAIEPQRVTPRELPPAVPGFTGRAAELKALTRILDQADGAPGTVVISAIGGTAGAGKTALALHWAHQVTDRFPDGQLHVNLRGFAPSGTPATPAEAIRGFLGALGVRPERIPLAPEAQASMYRSLLADRKMLIVLDNACDEDQVRPLLPVSPASLVLVTSRSQLTVLAAADGARLLSLDVLPRDEAVQLLTARLGQDRAAAEPDAIDEVAALCAHLPLALTIAAARAAARPRFPLAQLAAELRDSAGRLDALDAGHPAASVRAVFSWSYSQLSQPAARMFRLLGLHPGPDISVAAAASLAAVGEPGARRLLRELTRGCLITEHAPGRYGFHDLLRAYAARQARDTDTEPGCAAAVGRILDHYLHTVSQSRGLLRRRPEQEPLALAPPGPGTRPERPADHWQALAWFSAEHQVLLATATLVAETGTDRRAWQLPCAMSEHLCGRGRPYEQVAVMTSALAAAIRLNDAIGQAMSLRRLGMACAGLGDYAQARARLEHSLSLYQRLGDRTGEAVAQQNLAWVADNQGRPADALGHIDRAHGLVHATGDELAQAETLGSIGWYHAVLGNYQQARACCEQALALTAELGGSSLEHAIWDTLGYIEHRLGNFTQATAYFQAALALSRDVSDARLEGEILTHLGDTHHAAGDLPQALQAWQQALAIYRDIQHPDADKIRAKLANTNGTVLRTALSGRAESLSAAQRAAWACGTRPAHGLGATRARSGG